jgi:hypothetical protein
MMNRLSIWIHLQVTLIIISCVACSSGETLFAINIGGYNATKWDDALYLQDNTAPVTVNKKTFRGDSIFDTHSSIDQFEMAFPIGVGDSYT